MAYPFNFQNFLRPCGQVSDFPATTAWIYNIIKTRTK